MRKDKTFALINRFELECAWKRIWFSDEAKFSLRPPLNTQNDRIYREVRVKTDIPEEDLFMTNCSHLFFVMLQLHGMVKWSFDFLKDTVLSEFGRQEEKNS